MSFASVRLSCAATLVATTAVASAQAPASSAADRSHALNKFFSDYWQDVLAHSPETATEVGDRHYNAKWSDYSGAAVNATLEREQGFITRLSAIPTDGLSEQEKLSAHLLMRRLIDDQEGAQFKEWQMPVNQSNGPQTTVPQILDMMPFDNVEDYNNYIARLNAVPTMFAQVQESMSLGADAGRTQPKFIMEKVVAQVHALSTAKPEDSPFALPLKHFPASVPAAEQKRIRTEALDAITEKVQPAYDRFGRFLTAQYIPKCRTEPGAWSLPNGDAYYAYLVRRFTTTPKTPEQYHEIGLAEVKRDETEMLAIAKKMGYNDLKSFNAFIKSDPKQHPTSAQQLIDTYRGYLDGMKAKLPDLFGVLPTAQLKVVPVPDYAGPTAAPAYYEPGTPDGKRPGQFFVNTYHFADRSLTAGEAIAYHEGLPGHHLQISIAQEIKGLPDFRRFGGYGAFQEGWALYCERMPKEYGFYKDPYADYGRLNNDAWRAVRLVVDTGVHYKHWTRQQMVDYFHEHTAVDESSIDSEVDRYIAWPGQALSYKAGQLEILELRKRAQEKLGPAFNIKAFHDEVLDSGALPLDVLEKRVDAWIANGGK